MTARDHDSEVMYTFGRMKLIPNPNQLGIELESIQQNREHEVSYNASLSHGFGLNYSRN